MNRKNNKLYGTASYDGEHFLFSPDDPNINAVMPFCIGGKGRQNSDGTFEFESQGGHKSRASEIMKLPHGRVSETLDGFISLTVKVRTDSKDCHSGTFVVEAAMGVAAIRQYLGK